MMETVRSLCQLCPDHRFVALLHPAAPRQQTGFLLFACPRGMATPFASQTALAGLASVSAAAPAAIPPRTVPAGTLPPGTLVTVGKHNVTIERWLSEGMSFQEQILTAGGFAHVYIVRLKEKMKLADGSVGDVACLKRVVAPDKEALGIVRTEVDTMVGFLDFLSLW